MSKQTIDQSTIDVIDGIECLSRALAKGKWSRRDQGKLKQAIGFCMQVTGELDNIEIGPEAASTWSVMTEKGGRL